MWHGVVMAAACMETVVVVLYYMVCCDRHVLYIWLQPRACGMVNTIPLFIYI